MPDDPKKKRHDGKLIALSQAHERAYWSKAFGITQGRLREVVQEVGPSVMAVKGKLISLIESA